MKSLRVVHSLLCALVLVRPASTISAQAALDPAALLTDIRTAIVNRIDAGRGVGIVAGLLTADGRRRDAAHGVANSTSGALVTSHTLFEVGSLTEVFTALLLADMVERGEIGLDDPISKFLPARVVAPTHKGKQITLVDLATHTSGLPGNPTNLARPGIDGGYATYTIDDLYSFLSTFELTRDPGEEWAYSNVGMGLLAHLLARRAELPYETLLRTRVFRPLGMNETAVTVPDALKARTATGHGADLKPVASMDFGVLTGAGGLRSTLDDLLTFTAAELGLFDHPLAAAMRRMRSVTRPTGTPSMLQHLGWREIPAGGGLLFHDGGATGFRAALAIRPSAGIAAAALANTAIDDVSDVAVHGVFPPQPLRRFGGRAARRR